MPQMLQRPLISEISHVSLKLADQWPLDGSGPKGWQVKSPLWRQACNTHEGSQTAFSSGICCSCQDTADSKYSKQILQTWNDLETGEVQHCFNLWFQWVPNYKCPQLEEALSHNIHVCILDWHLNKGIDPYWFPLFNINWSDVLEWLKNSQKTTPGS